VGYLASMPIDVAVLLAAVAAPERGGTACFVGTVRNHHRGREVLRLEYSAYEPMAEAECDRIVVEAARQWPVQIAVQHRIGALAVGDVAIAAAAAAAHREHAFEACRYLVEEIKRRVPIWKRECYADGTVEWVDPTRAATTVMS
jgi:molybdopterin synthase catalytic subunit